MRAGCTVGPMSVRWRGQWMLCGIIGLRKSAATSEIVKHVFSRIWLAYGSAISSTRLHLFTVNRFPL